MESGECGGELNAWHWHPEIKHDHLPAAKGILLTGVGRNVVHGQTSRKGEEEKREEDATTRASSDGVITGELYTHV